MIKIGIAVPDLGNNQLAFSLIHKANALMEREFNVDLIAFYCNLVNPILNMSFSSMQLVEAYGYSGLLVATTLNTASNIIAFPGPKKKFFYVWDLEWMRHKTPSFSSLKDIYRNPELNLIARSGEHKRAIEESWNRSVVGIVDDFDMNQLLEVTKCQ